MSKTINGIILSDKLAAKVEGLKYEPSPTNGYGGKGPFLGNTEDGRSVLLWNVVEIDDDGSATYDGWCVV